MRALKRQKKKFLLAATLWAALLIFLALLPEETAVLVLRRPVFFMAAHLTAYFILAFLLCLYFRFRKVFFSLRMQGAAIACLALFFSMLCGGVTEAVQVLTPDRGPDWFDLACDVLGALAGICFFFLFSRTRVFRKTSIVKQTVPSFSKS